VFKGLLKIPITKYLKEGRDSLSNFPLQNIFSNLQTSLDFLFSWQTEKNEKNNISAGFDPVFCHSAR
jgi:hypothetical protein